MAGEIIHFERESDGKPGKFLLRQPDLGDVFIQLPVEHAPVVEVIARHRRMIGEADFCQAEFAGAACVIHRFAGRMAAERRVHVVIGGQRHGSSVETSGLGVEQKFAAGLKLMA